MTFEKIFIVGAGAVGKALAVILKLAGREVTIIRGTIDEGASYEEEISLVLANGKEVRATIPISTLSNLSALDGLIVLTNKSYGNEQLAKKLKHNGTFSPIVLLQNGLGVEQVFVDSGFAELYRCVLFVTSQAITANKINYKSIASSPIGTIQNNASHLAEVVKALDTTNFKFHAEEDIQKIIWEKAIVNCVFNSICPLLEVDNGIFARDENVFAMAQRVIKECIIISLKKGIDLSPTEVEKRLLTISKLSDGQLISTLQDIRHKRETEIDTLNFEIGRIAKALELENSVRETTLLGELTKLKAALSR